MGADLVLDVGEGHHRDGELAAPLGQHRRQIQHLLLGFHGSIRVAEEMHSPQLQPPFGHHPAGRRGVDPPGEQQHSPAGGAGGQPARPGDDAPGNKGVFLPHLYLDGDLGGIHLGLEMGEKVAEIAPHLAGDLRGGQGELLVGAPGLHLEGPGLSQERGQVFPGLFADIVNVLFAHRRPADGHDAEYPAADLHRLVHGDGGIQRLHINGGLAAVDAELPQLFQPPIEGPAQPVLELVAVEALEHQLAAFTKQNFFHIPYQTSRFF